MQATEDNYTPSSLHSSYSSNEDTASTTASSEPSTPIKFPLPPVPASPARPDSDTDTEEMDDNTSNRSISLGSAGLSTGNKTPQSTPTGGRTPIGTTDQNRIEPWLSESPKRRRFVLPNTPNSKAATGENPSPLDAAKRDPQRPKSSAGSPPPPQSQRTLVYGPELGTSPSGEAATPTQPLELRTTPQQQPAGGAQSDAREDTSHPDQRSGPDGRSSSPPYDEEAAMATLQLVYPISEVPKPVLGTGEEVTMQVPGKQGSGEETAKEEAGKQGSGEEAANSPMQDNLKPSSEVVVMSPQPNTDVKLMTGEEVPKQCTPQQEPAMSVQLNKSLVVTSVRVKGGEGGEGGEGGGGTTIAVQPATTTTTTTTRLFNRCQSENLLIPKETSDDLALAIIREDDQVDGRGGVGGGGDEGAGGGAAEMRKRTNTFSPSSKQMVGRRTPKEIKRVEKRKASMTRTDSSTSSTSVLKYLSPDMEAKIYERICKSLGEKYGSLEGANRAALTIQKAYRGYKLRRHYEEIRRPSAVRQRTATVRDRNRKLSIKSRPMKDRREDRVAKAASVVESMNSKRHSPGRTRVNLVKQGAGGGGGGGGGGVAAALPDDRNGDDVTPPLPPPLNPDDPCLRSGGANGEHPTYTTSTSTDTAAEPPRGENPTGGEGVSPHCQATVVVTTEDGVVLVRQHASHSVCTSESCSTDSQEVGGDGDSCRMTKSQSADLGARHRVSVFSVSSAGSVEGGGDGGGGGGGEGGGAGLRRVMSASMVTRSINIGVYLFNR